MRKITKDMLNAVLNATAWRSGNTRVDVDGDRIVVTLHGNQIATLNGGTLSVSWAGWPTPTTTDRIHALVSQLTGGPCIHQSGRPAHQRLEGAIQSVDSA